jgi:hypothetical protein
MRKAAAAGSDPLLGLLEWRNTPREGTECTPVQLLFGRNTRSHLPTSDAALRTTASAVAQQALDKSKTRQAEYYNRTAKERQPFEVGQTVRARFSDIHWRKAEVIKQLPHRSYQVRLEDGTVYR